MSPACFLRVRCRTTGHIPRFQASRCKNSFQKRDTLVHFSSRSLAFLGLSASKSYGEQPASGTAISKLVTPSIALVKQLPSLSVEPSFAHLLDRLVVRGTSVESDSGQ